MRKRILAAVLAVVMVVLLVPAVLISNIFAIPASALPNITIGDTKEIVVSEDFESTPIDPFFNLTGFAQAVDGTKGVYKGTSGTPIFFDQQQFGDGTLEFDVKMENISTIYRTLSMWSVSYTHLYKPLATYEWTGIRFIHISDVRKA